MLLLLLVPSAAARAQSNSDPAEPTEQGNEVVHSWALVPAGTEANGGDGNRPDLSYVADPGAVIEDAVTLYNLSNVPLTFQVYATDAYNDEAGKFAVLGTEETPAEVGTWVAVGENDIPVPAQTQVTIPIIITVPDNVRPGDHVGAILAANATVGTNSEGQEIVVDRRTGPRLYVRVNGPLVPEIAIADIETDHDGLVNPLSGSTTVRYTIEKRGNVRLSGVVQASVGGPLGVGERTGPEQEITDLLPGESFTVEEEFTGVPTLGAVVTTVRLDATDAGGASLETVERTATTFAPPLGLLLALLALLFGLLAARAFKRHRARSAAPIEVVTDEHITALSESEHQPT